MGKFKQGTHALSFSTKEYPAFSDRLKIAMQIRNCSVAELAASSYVTKSAICGYRSGHRSPDIIILRAIAESLDVSADFLLGLREDIYI